jgi:hypothetical protein
VNVYDPLRGMPVVELEVIESKESYATGKHLIKVSLITLINIDSEITSDHMDTYGKLILPFIFGKTSGITMARIHRKTTGERWLRKLWKSQ